MADDGAPAEGADDDADVAAQVASMQTDWHMAVSACAFLLEHLPRVGEAMGECEAVFLAAERVAGGGCQGLSQRLRGSSQFARTTRTDELHDVRRTLAHTAILLSRFVRSSLRVLARAAAKVDGAADAPPAPASPTKAKRASLVLTELLFPEPAQNPLARDAAPSPTNARKRTSSLMDDMSSIEDAAAALVAEAEDAPVTVDDLSALAVEAASCDWKRAQVAVAYLLHQIPVISLAFDEAARGAAPDALTKIDGAAAKMRCSSKTVHAFVAKLVRVLTRAARLVKSAAVCNDRRPVLAILCPCLSTRPPLL